MTISDPFAYAEDNKPYLVCGEKPYYYHAIVGFYGYTCYAVDLPVNMQPYIYQANPVMAFIFENQFWFYLIFGLSIFSVYGYKFWQKNKQYIKT